jgi:hypothetical protein
MNPVALSQRRNDHVLKQTRSLGLVAFLLMMEGAPAADAGSKLPDAISAGVAEKLFR